MSKPIPMEVKVIFVGVGVLVIWHLFSGKNDKQLEDLKSAAALDTDLASLRDTLKNYKQEWATMKQKYQANFQLYAEYWGADATAKRLSEGHTDEKTDLIDGIKSFNAAAGRDDVMGQIIDRKEELADYRDEASDFVNRNCMELLHEIRATHSAWDARLAAPPYTSTSFDPSTIW